MQGTTHIKEDELDQARIEFETARAAPATCSACRAPVRPYPGTRTPARHGRTGRDAGDPPAATRSARKRSPASCRWTGIPVSKMLEGETRKLLRMEGVLGKRVVGQDEAVRAVSNAVAVRAPDLPTPTAERLVPVPRPDRRRQDRAVQGAGRVPVRHRRRDGAHRHVGVHGETSVVPADRRAAGLRRLRRGRLPDRGGASPAVQRDPDGRGREGPSDVFNVLLQVLDDGTPDRRPGVAPSTSATPSSS